MYNNDRTETNCNGRLPTVRIRNSVSYFRIDLLMFELELTDGSVKSQRISKNHWLLTINIIHNSIP